MKENNELSKFSLFPQIPAVCVTRNVECNTCILKLKCVYSAIMESPVPENHLHSRKYKNSPHPYIIIPPLTQKRYFNPGDILSFEFVLIGKANEYLPYFVYTFTEMGKLGIGHHKGKFDVASVEELRFDGSVIGIYNDNNKILKNPDNRIDYGFFVDKELNNRDEITINFETPARIKVNDNLSTDLSFELLIKRLSERACLLAHFHCGAELADFEEFANGSEKIEIVNNRLEWVDWERYSSRQDTRMKFGGCIGKITYKGDLQKYLPLLKLGEYIHVGKVTTFGLGKYKIT
ncbi:CRISPR system precrRNA processing endoribonuclease RAMP protein Cas6 [Candidatus Desantisbacteria bacterium]|nr:CRISPR system precrRNA processing endoribonuclease RAMP protein Cas6 [Candidatus Desantisbacteria bacterium]